MHKKYKGKEPNKILYQETIDTIENNIKYVMPNLKFGLITNMKYYRAIEVNGIIKSCIIYLDNQKIIKEIESIESNIKNLKIVNIENEQYYSGFEITKILDYVINELVRKIFY